MLNPARRVNRDCCINLLTDFGFKRLFGTELTKALLIDFLNVVLPEQHFEKWLFLLKHLSELSDRPQPLQ